MNIKLGKDFRIVSVPGNLVLEKRIDKSFKRMHCIFKITQRQKELVARINKGNCNDCGMKTVSARYKGKVARLCTGCGRVLQDGRVAEVCWVNSKKVI